jgi:hypothetical protein
MLGWPNRCELARAFLWEHSGKRLELAQLPGQLGVFLTLGLGICPSTSPPPAPPRTTECRSPSSGTRTSTASPPELRFAAECRARLGPGIRLSSSPPPTPPRTSEYRAPSRGTRSRPRSRPSRALPLSGARANSSNAPDRRGTRGSESPPRWGSSHILFLTPSPRPRGARLLCRARDFHF